MATTSKYGAMTCLVCWRKDGVGRPMEYDGETKSWYCPRKHTLQEYRDVGIHVPEELTKENESWDT